MEETRHMVHRETPHRPRRARRPARRNEPFPVDVEDTAEAFTVTAELPGLRTRDVDVFAHGHTIRIVGNYDGAEPDDAIRLERPRGRVERTIHLPARIDVGRVTASYVNGLLRVTARKHHPATRVEVR